MGNAFYGIVLPLYSRDYWVILSQALKAGLSGDGSVLLQLSDLYTSRCADGYTDNSSEAIYAISCLDDPYAIAPDEVAVVGHDDIPMAAWLGPPLSTLRIAKRDLGVGAVRLLLERLGGAVGAGPVVLTPELVVGGSTGPLPDQ